MYFEIIGEITEIERIAAGGSIREIARLRKQFGPGGGVSSKVLPRCALPMVGYERSSCIGMKLMG